MIAGTSNSGKSTYLKQFISTLYLNNPSCDFTLIDLKNGLESIQFHNLPRIQVVIRPQEAVEKLARLQGVIAKRAKFLLENSCHKIEEFFALPKDKKKWTEDFKSDKDFGRHVIIVDEAAELFLVGAELNAEGASKALYYRLSSVILETTPLRDRPEDLEPLVVYFTREICKENGFSRAFHRRCLEVMRDHHWKGNVRELRSMVERHLIASDSDLIRVEDLDARLYRKKETDEPRTLKEIDNYLEGIKKQMVLEAVKSARTKAEAARKLDIPPNGLHYFVVKYGLEGK